MKTTSVTKEQLEDFAQQITTGATKRIKRIYENLGAELLHSANLEEVALGLVWDKLLW